MMNACNRATLLIHINNAATRVERSAKSMTPDAACSVVPPPSQKSKCVRDVWWIKSCAAPVHRWSYESQWPGVIDSSQQMSPCNPSAFVPFIGSSALISPPWMFNLPAGLLSNRLTSDSGSFLDKLNLANDKSGHAGLPSRRLSPGPVPIRQGS